MNLGFAALIMNTSYREEQFLYLVMYSVYYKFWLIQIVFLCDRLTAIEFFFVCGAC
jgi:hypothetical protein